ncbi:MAG: calcium-binding protein [Pseudomonadota bacterium]
MAFQTIASGTSGFQFTSHGTFARVEDGTLLSANGGSTIDFDVWDANFLSVAGTVANAGGDGIATTTASTDNVISITETGEVLSTSIGVELEGINSEVINAGLIQAFDDQRLTGIGIQTADFPDPVIISTDFGVAPEPIIGPEKPDHTIINSGTIEAVVGVNIRNVADPVLFSNSGTIRGTEKGVMLADHQTLVNTGIIAGDVAIKSANAVTVLNAGTVDGGVHDAIKVDAGGIIVENTGLIIGDIDASAGTTLSYEGSNGQVTGDIVGSAGNDTVIGGASDETVLGGGGDDTIRAAGGNDSITGADGDDEIFGGNGDDSLDGGRGDDVVSGGAGDDTLIATGDPTLSGGNDTLMGGVGDDVFVLSHDDHMLALGGAGDDYFTLDATHNTELRAGDGDDTVDASLQSGSDVHTIFTDAGNDRVYLGNVALNVVTGSGDDVVRTGSPFGLTANKTPSPQDSAQGVLLWLGAGSDIALLGAGDDSVVGGDGEDSLDAGDGNNTVHGGNGDDTLYADNGNDLITGGTGHDEIGAGAGNDTVRGQDGDDTLDAGAGDDMVVGGAGHDVILAGADDDTVFGVSGDDEVDAGAGDDLVHGHAGDDTLSGSDGHDTLRGGGGDDSIAGGNGSDYLTGDAGHDTLGGEAGADSILGGAGEDHLYGAEGADTLRGNGGDDFLNGGQGRDVLHGNRGDDFLDGRNARDHLHGDTGDDTLFGGSHDDILMGGTGDDSLYGGHGDDVLHGGAGNDTLRGGTDDDTFVLRLGQGHDTAEDFADGDLLDVSAFGVTSLNDVNPLLVSVNGGTLIAVNDTSSVFLAGVAAGSLTADDFVF